LFLRRGIRCWRGAGTRLVQQQQACMDYSVRGRTLGESKKDWHASRGRGACPQAPLPATQQRTWAPQRQGRWEFGEHHETFGKCDVGGSTTGSFWSLRPPAPGAGWSKALLIVRLQGRGEGATNGIRNNKPMQAEKNAPHPPVRTFAAHASTFTPKKHSAAWESFQL
jgi:hypothetical protein